MAGVSCLQVYCLPAEQPTSSVVFFAGDQLEAMGLPTRVLELQDPKCQVKTDQYLSASARQCLVANASAW